MEIKTEIGMEDSSSFLHEEEKLHTAATLFSNIIKSLIKTYES